MRASIFVVVVALLVVPLAGCVGSGGGPSAGPAEADDGGDGGDGPPDADAGDQANLTTLTYDAPNATQTISSNGTFAPQDACFAGGCITGDARHTVGLTEIVPADAPSRLYLNISYEELPNYQPVSVWLESEDTTFYGYSSTFEPGSIQIEILLVRAEAGTVETVVQLVAPNPSTEPDPNMDYQLQATSVPVPSRVDRGVPVEVELSPGQTIEATTAGQDADADELAFRVYGPDDAAVAYVASDDGSATWTVPENLTAGAYVLANTWTSDLELSATGDASMRALTVDYGYSDPTTYEGTGAAEWSFDVERDPLWAGIYVETVDVSGTGFESGQLTADGFDATLTLPGGQAVNASWDCTICVTAPVFGNAVLWFGPERGDPGLVSGTYDAQISSTASLGWQYGHIVAHYAR